MQPIPKSTGREEFNEDFINKVFRKFSNLKHSDILRTFIKFTSLSIKLNVEKFILSKFEIDELVISGGGALHPILINDIQKDFFSSILMTNI